uniref:Uncharacterized protein n=1 Tax=Rhodopseudomonas palustris (strain BisA53) TaxID=316055 RepID=Q07N09_RHOP5
MPLSPDDVQIRRIGIWVSSARGSGFRQRGSAESSNRQRTDEFFVSFAAISDAVKRPRTLQNTGFSGMAGVGGGVGDGRRE